MVAPLMVPAAQAASAAGSAGATALGLGMGKTDLDLTRDLFKMQMRQAKRLWTADWAEASMRHGEACLQSAQQHSESQAMAAVTYAQAERLTAQGIKLARDQDARAYEMSWRAEVRESLRDELANQNNRFNIIMLCDTVCLSCVFSLVTDGNPPIETPNVTRNIYVFGIGFSIMLFTISLWCSVIVVRRLHEHTASILERKLFAQSEDLQETWQHQLDQNLPTGPIVMFMMNQAYEKWCSDYIDPLGEWSIHMLSVGVVAMFVTAGLLTHSRYLIEYNAISSVVIFWSIVILTSVAILFMKFTEDAKEKKKEGVYDVSWQDNNGHAIEKGPFAKIYKSAKELYSENAVRLVNSERMNLLGQQEETQREMVPKTSSLHERVTQLRKDSAHRSKTRKEVLQLLTTAAEEREALPEDLTARLNKVLHDIDDADRRTAKLVSMKSERSLGSRASWGNRFSPLGSGLGQRLSMAPDPIDAQRLPVTLTAIRKKLGEIPRTTLLRLQNLSNEPLRLQSGMQLRDGKYFDNLRTTDRDTGNLVNYQLYPITEIPPRTEVVIAARSGGGGWLATSGIEGTLVYTNKDMTWSFRIHFRNGLVRNHRSVQVQASPVANRNSTLLNQISFDQLSISRDNDDDNNSNIHDPTAAYWQISKDVVDRKANNEIIITMQVEYGAQAKLDHDESTKCLKEGFLLKNSPFGLRLRWQARWFVLTPTQLVYSAEKDTPVKKNSISVHDIVKVRVGRDMIQKHVFEIHTRSSYGREPYKLACASAAEQAEWIRLIQSVLVSGSSDTSSSLREEQEEEERQMVADSIECVLSDTGIEADVHSSADDNNI